MLWYRQNMSQECFLAGSFKEHAVALSEESLPLACLQFLIITKLRETPSNILWPRTLPTSILHCIPNEEKCIRVACSGILSTCEILFPLETILTSQEPEGSVLSQNVEGGVCTHGNFLCVVDAFFFFLKKSKLVFWSYKISYESADSGI